ncbi:hypothetical protein [Pseudomarimonas salicorniae]|uniref:Cytochrome c domain-containing protein n=1 Tax=Pseudomarimonas salicorniae TaxID=2933270 RepID=A0ABT0GEP2_9GAMM|nr:hypothetical protein [Lysobacter sp. CAU 1642]MCK7593017.1 hypothetical protein [Lysobacter sp. CAU 1642]
MPTPTITVEAAAGPARAGRALGRLLAGLSGCVASLALASPLPERLSDTGLFETGTTKVASEHLAFSPQYPLWTDGARKRRWISLPPGTQIDASDPDAWEFPPGTRLWKEFAYERPVETRYIERLADGSWRYATYVWTEDGRDAVLASDRGQRLEQVAGSPDGRYEVPSRFDCQGCHEAAATRVLGFSALQLSHDREPTPARTGSDEIDLRALIERELLRNAPTLWTDQPPRIAGSDEERAVLGYLHGNCSHCHNRVGPMASLELYLDQRSDSDAASVLASLIEPPARTRAADLDRRLVPGNSKHSQLFARMASRNPYIQMPPLGTRHPDSSALVLIQRWIDHLPAH